MTPITAINIWVITPGNSKKKKKKGKIEKLMTTKNPWHISNEFLFKIAYKVIPKNAIIVVATASRIIYGSKKLTKRDTVYALQTVKIEHIIKLTGHILNYSKKQTIVSKIKIDTKALI